MAQALRWDDEAADAQGASSSEEDDGDGDGGKAEGQPPATKDIFDMLFDDVEERHVEEYGISRDSELYVGVFALFKERLAAELREAVKYTGMARLFAETEEDTAS